MYSLSLTVNNILNPFPAITTSSFIISFFYANQTLIDYSQSPINVGLTTGTATCAKTITNGIVYNVGTILVNFTQKNLITNGSIVYLMISMSRSYSTDPNSTNINPSIQSSNVSGTYNFYLLYQTSGFNISMLMPPSTQSVNNFITVTSYILSGTTQNNIDSCSINIDGITPNSLNNLMITGGSVQSTANMTFIFTIQTPFFIN